MHKEGFFEWSHTEKKGNPHSFVLDGHIPMTTKKNKTKEKPHNSFEMSRRPESRNRMFQWSLKVERIVLQ